MQCNAMQCYNIYYLLYMYIAEAKYNRNVFYNMSCPVDRVVHVFARTPVEHRKDCNLVLFAASSTYFYTS